jgi:hypothetical protein
LSGSLAVLAVQTTPEEEDDDEAAVDDEEDDDELEVDASASEPPSVTPPPIPPAPPPDPELVDTPLVLALELDMPPVAASSLRAGKQLTATVLGSATNASRATRPAELRGAPGRRRSIRIRKPPSRRHRPRLD